jgi:dUTP pyrophosphatase
MKIKYFKINEGVVEPIRGTAHAAAMDLSACITDKHALMDNGIKYMVVHPYGGITLIPTGIIPEIPTGYELDIRPRSGLALKAGITVLNTPGTIDEDYRGEIGVILINHSKETFVVRHGERICQAVLLKCEEQEWEAVKTKEELSSTDRGAGRFGHTGR